MAAAQRAHAIFKVKAEGSTRLVVLDTQDLSLGRAPENDLAIDDPELSRKHAIFQRLPTGCRVSDLGTPNGTGVNGESVDHAELRHGDVVRVGAVEITYAETTRNPASLGSSVEYASQLKSFATPLSDADPESTILGLGTAIGGDTSEALEVQPAGDFDFDLAQAEASGTRDLDRELADLGSDPVAGPAPTAAAPVAAPAAAAPASRDEIWELEESGASSTGGRLSLTLEIEGLEGELRQTLSALVGKVLELPKLRVRIKSED